MDLPGAPSDAAPDAASDKPFRLTDKQQEKQRLIAGAPTHLLDFGGSRGGKTFGWVRPIALRAIAAPGSRHLVARFRHNAVKRSIMHDTFPKVMKLCFPGVAYRMHKQEGYAEIATEGEPSQVWFQGLDSQERIDKILGTEYATIFVDEASEVGYEEILVLRTRLAQAVKIAHGPNAGRLLRLKMFYSLNPTSQRHWSYREIIKKVSPVDGLPLANASDFAFMTTSPYDNAANLPPGYIEGLKALPRLQRARFLEGRYLADVEGALWKTALFRRVPENRRPVLARIVVAVDPSGAQHAKDVTADEIGIVVAGVTVDGVVYLLRDLSLRASPEKWGRMVVAAANNYGADAIIAESNYGGPMVKALIQMIGCKVPVRLITATRAKHVRAEPVAGLYEAGRVVHIGPADEWETLEDQLLQFTVAGYIGPDSPDRADAAVWAITELALKPGAAKATGGALAS